MLCYNIKNNSNAAVVIFYLFSISGIMYFKQLYCVYPLTFNQPCHIKCIYLLLNNVSVNYKSEACRKIST